MKKENYKGYNIAIMVDEYPENPREWDGDTKMVMFHKRYILPCEIDIDHEDFNLWDEIEEYIRSNYKVTAIEPVYMYDHSGITVSTTPFSCRGDSGQVGFVFVEEAETKDYTHALRIIKSEIEEYDNYLTGNVYGYQVYGDGGIEELDTCWGFYGDIERSGLMDEARSSIDYYIKRKQEQKENQLKTYLVNKVPLEYRWRTA